MTLPKLSLLKLKRGLTHSFIVPNGLHLGSQHDSGEDCEEERLENKEQKENDSRWWRVDGALLPLVPNAENEMIHRQEESVYRY